MVWRGRLFAATLFGSLLAESAALASGTNASAPPVRPGVIEWLTPTPAQLAVASEEQKKAWQANGRDLPTPELLQPELDAALQRYTATPNLQINRRFKVGSSDILPTLVKAWEAAFRRHHPGFSLEIDKPMAGSLGTLELIKEQVDAVFVSRELKPSDITGFRAKFGYAPQSIPIVGGTWRHFGFLDAMPIIVHKDNPITGLSFRQLDAAFSSTRHRGGTPVRTWGDLGLTGPWAKRPVRLYGIKPWNGFEEFVRQRVLSTPGKRGEWRDDITVDSTFFPVARRIANDPNGLGYTGLSAVDSEVRVVPVAVDDGGPALSPTYENVAAATYPLSRLVYLNTNPRLAGTDPALQEFLRFILSRDGQAVVRQHGIFLPLRAHQVAEARAMIGR